jgi:hypothetical protein
VSFRPVTRRPTTSRWSAWGQRRDRAINGPSRHHLGLAQVFEALHHFLGNRPEVDQYIESNRIPEEWSGKRFDPATKKGDKSNNITASSYFAIVYVVFIGLIPFFPAPFLLDLSPFFLRRFYWTYPLFF